MTKKTPKIGNVHNSRRKRRKYKLAGLPPYVVIKKGAWHVRMTFPTSKRDAKGRLIYEEVARKCEPETAERAAEVAEWIRDEKKDAKAAAPTGPQTLGTFLEFFLSVKADTVTRRTLDGYQYLFEQHVKNDAIARLPLEDVKKIRMQTFFTDLKASPQRKRKLYVLLNMALKAAIEWEMIERNPVSKIMLPPAKPKESVAMKPAEARRFIKACRKDDRFIIFEVALNLALRPQECIALRWSDVDLARRRVKISQAIAQGFRSGGFEVKQPKTASSAAVMSLNDETCDALRRQRAVVDRELKRLKRVAAMPLETQKKGTGANYKKRISRQQHAKDRLSVFAKYDLVFPAANGLPLALNNLNRRSLVDLMKAAKIESGRYTFKSLRHTAITLAAENLRPRKLQQFARHADIKTTMTYYVHLDDDSQVEASTKMAAALY